jgi:hypothetical protein
MYGPIVKFTIKDFCETYMSILIISNQEPDEFIIIFYLEGLIY